MKLYIEIILLVIIVVCIGYLFFYFSKTVIAPSTIQNLENKVCLAREATAEGLGNNCFYVELAKTQAERDKGLMNRSHLDQNKGMFFIFEKEGNHPFWMKNTLIPLDIIWLDSGKNIVYVAENVQPCKSLICPAINPNVKAKYVLEINAGIANNIGLKIGDKASVTVSGE